MLGLKEYLADGDILNFETGVGWVITIKDSAAHENIIKQLAKFRPESIALDKDLMPILFDE